MAPKGLGLGSNMGRKSSGSDRYGWRGLNKGLDGATKTSMG
jgi:hypothetical protein